MLSPRPKAVRFSTKSFGGLAFELGVSALENVMANNLNRSSVRVTLTDVYSNGLVDRVNLKFYNVRLTTERSQADVTFTGQPVTIGDLPAFPEGLTQVFMAPTRYRFKSIFLNVQSDGSSQISEPFFVDPNRVTPQFPTFADIESRPIWDGLARILRASNISSAPAWNALGDQPRAGLLNVYCKMNTALVEGPRPVTDFIQSIDQFLPARIFARVHPNLIRLVDTAPKNFHTVSGALHSFDPPWQPTTPENSWKTFDRAGNLQLTFATDGNNNFLADIDLDDHQGVQHAFDVFQHTLTGKDTHPYDIHEILIFFQHLDPGYSFA